MLKFTGQMYEEFHARRPRPQGLPILRGTGEQSDMSVIALSFQPNPSIATRRK